MATRKPMLGYDELKRRCAGVTLGSLARMVGSVPLTKPGSMFMGVVRPFLRQEYPGILSHPAMRPWVWKLELLHVVVRAAANAERFADEWDEPYTSEKVYELVGSMASAAIATLAVCQRSGHTVSEAVANAVDTWKKPEQPPAVSMGPDEMAEAMSCVRTAAEGLIVRLVRDTINPPEDAHDNPYETILRFSEKETLDALIALIADTISLFNFDYRVMVTLYLQMFDDTRKFWKHA